MALKTGMSGLWKIGMITLVVAGLSGCRLKSVDSYLSATTPNPTELKVTDPYSFGGVAYGTGGLVTNMSYGTGARGENIGAPKYFARMKAYAGKGKTTWDVDDDPINEKSGQFQTPWIGRVKDNPASPFGTLEGY